MSKKLSGGPAWPSDESLVSSRHKDIRAKVLTDLLPANITNTDDLLKKGSINITLFRKPPLR